MHRATTCHWKNSTSAHVQPRYWRSSEPLVLSSARKPEETLYVYRQEIWSDHGGEWRVSLGGANG
jgi:hypothetical protein